jgi:hypothetical protein
MNHNQYGDREPKTMHDTGTMPVMAEKIISVQTDAGIEARIVTSREGNGKPAVRTPEKRDGLNSGTGD